MLYPKQNIHLNETQVIRHLLDWRDTKGYPDLRHFYNTTIPFTIRLAQLAFPDTRVCWQLAMFFVLTLASGTMLNRVTLTLF